MEYAGAVASRPIERPSVKPIAFALSPLEPAGASAGSGAAAGVGTGSVIWHLLDQLFPHTIADNATIP